MKKFLIIALCSLVAIQFFKAKKENVSNDNQFHLSTKYDFPAEIESIIKTSCYDCHSNYSDYTVFHNYQPFGWWMNGHVKGGKKHLNFSEFTNNKIAVQNHKFEEIIETVGEHKSMPLKSYTYFGLHPKAKLSDDQRQIVVNWAKAQMDSIKSHYPADSLILKKKS